MRRAAMRRRRAAPVAGALWVNSQMSRGAPSGWGVLSMGWSPGRVLARGRRRRPLGTSFVTSDACQGKPADWAAALRVQAVTVEPQ